MFLLARLLRDAVLGDRACYGLLLGTGVDSSLVPLSTRVALEHRIVPDAARFWERIRFFEQPALPPVVQTTCDKCLVHRHMRTRTDAVAALVYDLAGGDDVVREQRDAFNLNFQRCDCFPSLKRWNRRIRTLVLAMARNDCIPGSEADLDMRQLVDTLSRGERIPYADTSWRMRVTWMYMVTPPM